MPSESCRLVKDSRLKNIEYISEQRAEVTVGVAGRSPVIVIELDRA